MDVKSKYQIEIDDFRNHFLKFQDKKIVIYGIGRRTATLLPAITNYFNIIGLLDRDAINVGKFVSGIPIFTLAEAEKKADLIIINSDPTNYHIIYRRIASTKLPVYYANGKRACLDSESYQKKIYWKSTYAGLKNFIDDHEVISFDFFDTLVMRRLLSPTDVFRLMAERVKGEFKWEFDIAVVRQQAAGNSSSGTELTLVAIYEEIAAKMNISLSDANKLMELELEIEREICVPRMAMIELFEYARKCGKDVFIVSDTYLSFDQIKPLFDKCEINDFPLDHIVLSSEKGKNKKDGTIWSEVVGELNGRSMLHIGDDIDSDIKTPKAYGIDTYYIMSGKDMMTQSSLSCLLPQAISLADSVHIGLLIVKLFANPFALAETKGKVHIADAETFGYVTIGGVITRFLCWLCDKVFKNKYDRLFFFGRDGYFLIRDYEYLHQFMPTVNFWPKMIYMPISRRLIYLATIENETDFYRVAAFPYMGTFATYLKSRFNIEASNATAEYNEITINAASDGDKIMKWLDPYRDAIAKECMWERQNYKSYLEKQGILSDGKHEAIVDFSYYGTNQYYFQKIIDRKIDGYYFSACYSPDNEYLKTCALHACFNDEHDPTAALSYVKQKSAFLESFLTAPYGMIRYIDEEGRMVCEPDKMNQKNFAVKEAVNEGIKEYLQDFLLFYGFHGQSGKNGIEAFTYYTLLNGGCTTADDVIKGFYFDNDMVDGREMQLEL